jgi:hypothetical protein
MTTMAHRISKWNVHDAAADTATLASCQQVSCACADVYNTQQHTRQHGDALQEVRSAGIMAVWRPEYLPTFHQVYQGLSAPHHNATFQSST